MMKTKYKVGDKVRVRKDLIAYTRYSMENDRGNNNSFVGSMKDLLGKVVTIKEYSCNGQYILCEDPRRFSWTDEMFEPINKKILITTDGTTTLARQYEGQKVVKSAEAKCSLDDTFDFMIGAKLAFERLTGEAEKPEPEKPEFEKGDIVKVTGNSGPYHHLRIGGYAVVESEAEAGNIIAVKGLDKKESTLAHQTVSTKDLELIETAKVEMTKPLFKVGDLVRVKEHYSHYMPDGTIAIVSRVLDALDSLIVHGKTDTGGNQERQQIKKDLCEPVTVREEAEA